MRVFLFWFCVHFINKKFFYFNCVHFINKVRLLMTLQWAWVTSILKCVVCYRWRFLWLYAFFRFFSSSLFDILIAFEKFRYLICSYSMALSLEYSSFARTWVLPSCAIFSPFVGCFVLLMISKFSSFKSKVKILGKDFSMMYYTIWVLHYYTLPMTINYFFLIMIFNNSLLFLSMSILT